jgi:hypothetical protein
MARTLGYIGSIEVETRGTDRVWFSLTEQDSGANWVKIDDVRAWFQMKVEPSEARPVEMAKLAMLFDAMKEGYQVAVYHPDAPRSDIYRMETNDTFDAEKVRTLRTGIHF